MYLDSLISSPFFICVILVLRSHFVKCRKLFNHSVTTYQRNVVRAVVLDSIGFDVGVMNVSSASKSEFFTF